MRLVEGGDEGTIKEIREENTLCYRGLVQQRRLRVAKGSFSKAFVPLGGVSISTESAPLGRVEDERGRIQCGELLFPAVVDDPRCLNPHGCSVSRLRSSNRTCGFPASGSPTGFTPRHTIADRHAADAIGGHRAGQTPAQPSSAGS